MKAIRILGVMCLMLISFSSFATLHVVNQSGFRFSPATLTVNVGDVIRWVWSNDSHTTTSKTVPTGAQPWNAPLTSSNTSFEYTVNVAGSYSYFCIPHETMGMTGTFTAVVSTGIGEFDIPKAISIFPNPATSIVNIKTGLFGEVIVSDVLGKHISKNQIADLPISDDTYRLDITDLTSGIYIISILPSNSKKRYSLKFVKE